MQKSKAFIAGALAAVFVAASASSADAYWHGRHGYYRGYNRGYYGGPGPVAGLVGGVLVGAATIATAPFALVGAALGARPSGYYGPPPPDAYGPPPGYYPPPPPPDYYGYRRGYYGDRW